MSEIVPIVLSSAVGVLSGSIGAYAIAKKILNHGKIMDLIMEFSDEIATNKDLQQRIYTVGAILGQGIKGGVGLQSKGGKFKLDDIIGIAISQFLPKLFPQTGQEQPAEQPQDFKVGLG